MGALAVFPAADSRARIAEATKMNWQKRDPDAIQVGHQEAGHVGARRRSSSGYPRTARHYMSDEAMVPASVVLLLWSMIAHGDVPVVPFTLGETSSRKFGELVQQAAYQLSGNGKNGQAIPSSFAALASRAFGDGWSAIMALRTPPEKTCQHSARTLKLWRGVSSRTGYRQISRAYCPLSHSRPACIGHDR